MIALLENLMVHFHTAPTRFYYQMFAIFEAIVFIHSKNSSPFDFFHG